MRLIDADALIKEAMKSPNFFIIKYKVQNAPTVDAVPVVRCKDCKFAYMTYGGECKYCDVWESEDSLYLDGDFFCAFGERKE